MPARARPLVILLASAVALSAVLIGATPTFAAPAVMPMPRERFLTPAERLAVRTAMTPAEAAAIGHLFERSDRDLLIGYSSAEFAVEKGDDGSLSFHPIGIQQPNAISAISLPNRMVAASDYDDVDGTSLYLSMTVNKQTSSSPYRFQALIYSEWRGEAGMNLGNDSRDRMSVAWSGAPAYTSSTWSSRYKVQGGCSHGGSMDTRRDSVISNGATFSFQEWKDGGFACRAHWALMVVNFRETSFQNKAGTVSYTYHHTYGGLSYTISLSKTPSIGISPTSEQWPAALGVGYTY